VYVRKRIFETLCHIHVLSICLQFVVQGHENIQRKLWCALMWIKFIFVILEGERKEKLRNVSIFTDHCVAI
jgi:hypothetical protein